MFFQGVSSVLLLDRSGNDMLCSILFLSLGFDVLTDHFNWCASCRQKAETLTPEYFFPKFFLSLWSIFSIKPILFLNNYLIDLFYYTMDFIAKQVFFLFFAIHLPPVEEGEFFLYIILKKLLWQPKELPLIISWQLYSYCSRPSQ